MFFLLLSSGYLSVYSQNGGITVQMKSGEIIKTNYVLFSNGRGLNPSPYIKINGLKGTKFSMKSIHHVEGYDGKKDYRYILPIGSNGGKEVWSEQVFTSDKTTIYYRYFNSSSWSRPVVYKSNNYHYTMGGTKLMKMEYKNLERDIGHLEIPASHLKKGNRVRIAQIFMLTVGSALIVHGLAEFTKGSGNIKIFDGSTDASSFYIHSSLLIGAALTNGSFFLLNPVKLKHFKNALKSVR